LSAAQFGSTYASAYDSMYAAKDYEAECDLVEEAFRRAGAGGPIERVLDLGCGTGNHAIPLARRGYTVSGVDLSEEMLGIARRKALEARVELALHEGDARTARLGTQFDAALLMFAVLGYQRTNEDVLATLRTARVHLRDGGMLVLDVWYGPGVLRDPPGEGVRTIQTPDGPLERKVSGSLDVRRQLCTVEYELAGGRGDARETHVMRFFFPAEIELFLTVAGFELVSLSPFGTLDGEPGLGDWNATVVARASETALE
jgi:SAM-dependent methyltransferase